MAGYDEGDEVPPHSNPADGGAVFLAVTLGVLLLFAGFLLGMLVDRFFLGSF